MAPHLVNNNNNFTILLSSFILAVNNILFFLLYIYIIIFNQRHSLQLVIIFGVYTVATIGASRRLVKLTIVSSTQTTCTLVA